MNSFRMAMMAMAAATVVTGSAMSVSGALAADGSLAPGKPAGVHQAARSPSLLLIGGAALVTVVAVVVATQSSDSAGCGAACSSPTTTS